MALSILVESQEQAHRARGLLRQPTKITELDDECGPIPGIFNKMKQQKRGTISNHATKFEIKSEIKKHEEGEGKHLCYRPKIVFERRLGFSKSTWITLFFWYYQKQKYFFWRFFTFFFFFESYIFFKKVTQESELNKCVTQEMWSSVPNSAGGSESIDPAPQEKWPILSWGGQEKF